MGTYYIPSNKLKGENRILIIFSTKALIYTAALGLIGYIFYKILSGVGYATLRIDSYGIFRTSWFCNWDI